MRACHQYADDEPQQQHPPDKSDNAAYMAGIRDDGQIGRSFGIVVLFLCLAYLHVHRPETGSQQRTAVDILPDSDASAPAVQRILEAAH